MSEPISAKRIEEIRKLTRSTMVTGQAYHNAIVDLLAAYDEHEKELAESKMAQLGFTGVSRNAVIEQPKSLRPAEWVTNQWLGNDREYRRWLVGLAMRELMKHMPNAFGEQRERYFVSCRALATQAREQADAQFAAVKEQESIE